MSQTRISSRERKFLYVFFAMVGVCGLIVAANTAHVLGWFDTFPAKTSILYNSRGFRVMAARDAEALSLAQEFLEKATSSQEAVLRSLEVDRRIIYVENGVRAELLGEKDAGFRAKQVEVILRNGAAAGQHVFVTSSVVSQ